MTELQTDWLVNEHARRDDMRTSLLAAVSMEGCAKAIAARVLQSIIESGPGTYSGIAWRTGLEPAQVWRRLSDLKNWGLIEPTGYTEPGASGRAQTIWRAVP